RCSVVDGCGRASTHRVTRRTLASRLPHTRPLPGQEQRLAPRHQPAPIRECRVPHEGVSMLTPTLLTEADKRSLAEDNPWSDATVAASIQTAQQFQSQQVDKEP